MPDGSKPIVAATSYPPIVEKMAAYHGGKRPRTIFIAIHCTAGSESLQAAENTQAQFADVNQAHTSAHESIDGNTICRSVPLDLIAYHAGHTANHCALSLEICGLATQTREQWLDTLSLPALQLAALRVAEWCVEYDIPPVYRDYTELQCGVADIASHAGITTHADISRAWHESDHTDPGPNFPLADFIAAVRTCRDAIVAGKAVVA